MMEVVSEMPSNTDFANIGGLKEPAQPVTPQKGDAAKDQDATPQSAESSENTGSSGKPKSKYKGKGLDSKGRPRNFYNPPGKVLRHLAQQSYYDNFYGNQGQFYTLKQKYKTQMCKHFLDSGKCPLQQFCQFAHGPSELRQPNDPLPKNFGKTALGAVHSNYKTEPCKFVQNGEECKFGEGCSFYHNEEERRRLIDPLPNLPEGVTLPPMPEKMKSHNRKNGHYNNRQNGNHGGHFDNMNQMPAAPFTPMNNQASMIQINNLADLAAFTAGFGGFNPNKYLQPMPMGYQGGYQGFNMVYQQQMFQPYPQGQGQGQKPNKGSQKGGQQRYEKKDKPSSPSTGTSKSGKKDKGEQKKYVTKQKKEESSTKKSASKPVEANASQ